MTNIIHAEAGNIPINMATSQFSMLNIIVSVQPGGSIKYTPILYIVHPPYPIYQKI